jgi:excisionase family DNA binding protein
VVLQIAERKRSIKTEKADGGGKPPSELAAMLNANNSHNSSEPVGQALNLQVCPTSEWLTASEAARYVKIKPRTLQLWARLGKVKGYALSGTKRHVWRFRRADLDAALMGSTMLDSMSPPVLGKGIQ